MDWKFLLGDKIENNEQKVDQTKQTQNPMEINNTNTQYQFKTQINHQVNLDSQPQKQQTEQTINKQTITSNNLDDEELFPPHTILVPARNPKDGAILRFTELFAPTKYKTFGTDPFLVKKKKLKKKKPVFKVDKKLEVANDQEQIFTNLKKEIIIKTEQPKPPKKEEKKEEKIIEDTSKKIDVFDYDIYAQRASFLPLDQIEWENHIIWEDPDSTLETSTKQLLNLKIDDQNSNDDKNTKKTSNEPEVKIIPNPRFKEVNVSLWGTIGEPKKEKSIKTEKTQENKPNPEKSNQTSIVDVINSKSNQEGTSIMNGILGTSEKVILKPPPITPLNIQTAPTLIHTPLNAPVTARLPGPSTPTRIPAVMNTMRLTPTGITPITPTLQPHQVPIVPRPIVPSNVTQFSSTTPSIISQLQTPQDQDFGDLDPDKKDDKKKSNRRRYQRRKKKFGETDQDEVPLIKPMDSMVENLNENSKVVQIETRQNDKLGKVLNMSLLTGEWMESIYWDERPAKPLNTKLILDLNDKYMIFNEKQSEETKDTDENEKKKKLKHLETEEVNQQKQNIYNLSNDANYEEVERLQRGQRKGRHIVEHSLPALRLDKTYFRTWIDEDGLRNLHRPFYKFPLNQKIPIQYRPPKKEKRGRRKHVPIEKKSQLSAHDHRVILLEYIEEKPVLLNNVGMGTKICNYYKKPNDDEGSIPKCADGIPILVESEDCLPLLGPLKEGEFFTSTENGMFSAQIFPHKPPETDFLLTTRYSSDGSLKFYIREIPLYYTVGHQQPHVEVPSPNSRSAVQFIKNRLTLYIFRQFKKKSRREDMKIRIDDIKEAFPGMSETSIRKRLKDCADFQRGGGDSGWWTAKPDIVIPSEDQLQLLVTPEMVCMNESMLAGELRLNDCGITSEASMAGFASPETLKGREDIRNTIRFIEQEQMNTPWNKSTNVINALEGKEGANLYLLSVAVQNLTKKELEEYSAMIAAAGKEDNDKANQIPLTHQEAKEILMEKGGYTEDRIKRMTRADRKNHARKILEAMGQGGKKIPAKESARNNKLREVLQLIFAREAEKLSKGIPYYQEESEQTTQTTETNTENISKPNTITSKPNTITSPTTEETLNSGDDSEDDLDLEKELETMLEEQSEEKKSESDTYMDELEEERELQNLLEEGMFGGAGSDEGSDSETASVTSETSATTNVTTPKPKKRRQVVRKTTKITLPDGTKQIKVEIIRDPAIVEYYKRKKEESENPKLKKKKGKTYLGGDTNDMFQSGSKERRRLQDQFRRWKKLKEQKSASGIASVPKKPKKEPKEKTKKSRSKGAQIRTNIRCGACGQIGHMLTNKSCPKYHETMKSSEYVKLEKGTKIKIDKKALTQDKESLKIQIPASVLQKAQEKSKASKRKADQLPDYLSPRPQIKRRRKTYADSIASILGKIVEKLKNHPSSLPFRQPVDVREYPEYKKIISKPIDLSLIHRKIHNLEYLDKESFMKDLELMVDNAHKFCETRFPKIPPMADELLEYAKQEIAKVEHKLEALKNEPTTPATPKPDSNKANGKKSKKKNSQSNDGEKSPTSQSSGDTSPTTTQSNISTNTSINDVEIIEPQKQQ